MLTKATRSRSAAEAGRQFHRNRSRFWAALSALILGLAAFAGAPASRVVFAQGSAGVQNLDSEAFRNEAYSKYANAMMYLNNGEPDKAVAVARQITLLNIPPEYEPNVVTSMKNITSKLCLDGPAGKPKDSRRFDLAQTLLDDTFKVLTENSCRADILMQRAVLYRLAGDDKNAVKFFQLAESLRKLVGDAELISKSLKN